LIVKLAELQRSVPSSTFLTQTNQVTKRRTLTRGISVTG